jgi:hypothetical protein
MKRKLFFLFLLAAVEINAQVNLNATLNNLKRKTPLIGFNGQCNFSMSTWTVQAWRDSLATLNSAVFRYPGGTNSNYFDWQTGWYQSAPSTPTWVASLQYTASVKAQDLKIGLNACQAKAIMVLNFQNSTINYQLQAINNAVNKGLSVDYIEVGNEHNIYASTAQYIPAGVYASGGKTWADSLKAQYPNSKICLVGGAGQHSLTTGWHDSIFSKNPNIDALSFHIYLGAGNTDNKFCTKRALSMPFHANTGVSNRYLISKFTNSVVPNNIEVWATEFNMSEQIAGNPLQHAGTWTHALFVSAMSHLLLKELKISMILNHNVSGFKDFAAVDTGKNVMANGIAMQLLGEVSKGTDSTALIDFNGQANVIWSTTAYPSLIGWKFWKGAIENAWICNLSSGFVKVSADEILGNYFSFDNYSADSAFFVKGIKSINHSFGFSNDTVSLPPFSINILKKQTTTGINKQYKLDDFYLYPNPTYNYLNFSEEIEMFSLLDESGREVMTFLEARRGIPVKDLAPGIYFLKLNGKCIKFIITR